MEKKEFPPVSPYKELIPDRKSEREVGTIPIQPKEEAPQIEQPEQTFKELLTEILNDTAKEQPVDAASVPSAEQSSVPNASETQAAREKDEKEIAAIAQELFERRMHGETSEQIDALLVERGIKPWTPEAEELIHQRDWEQIKQTLNALAQERSAATQTVSRVEQPLPVEHTPQEMRSVQERFVSFGIDPEALTQIEGFDSLSYGQQLLMAQRLEQFTLGRITEDADDRYRAGVADASILGSKQLGKVWYGISKQYQQAKYSRATVKDIKAGGLAVHGDVLRQLAASIQGSGFDVVETHSGSLEFRYAQEHPLMDEQQKKDVHMFNAVATAYGAMPYEWGLETATPEQRREFNRVAARFDRAKEHLLVATSVISGERDALLFLANIEGELRLNQLLQTHSAAGQQIKAIEDDPVWRKTIKNVATERGIYVGTGAVARSVGVGLLGAIALPVVATIMGGWMARRRALQLLRERDVAARRGKRDSGVEARNVVIAHDQQKKIELLLKKIESETDADKRVAHLASLQVRLEYVHDKLDHGLIDFGSADRRIVNQYGLIDALTMGTSIVGVEDVASRGDVAKRLESFLQFKEKNITKARKDLVRKQMIYGAGLGAASFASGYFVRDLFAAGGDDVVANAVSHPRQASAATESVAPHVAERVLAPIAIGVRGPEGALIDTFKQDPELARQFGWDGKSDLNTWAGKRAHVLWEKDVQRQLVRPEVATQLQKAGYSVDAQGYAEAMRHIGKGSITLDLQAKKFSIKDVEFLRSCSVDAPEAIASVIEQRPTEDVQVVSGIPVEEHAVVAQLEPHIVEGVAVADTQEGGMEDSMQTTVEPQIELASGLIPPARLNLIERDIFGDRVNAARKIVLHYRLGNISAKDLTQYYAGMVDGVQDNTETSARVQRILRDASEGSTNVVRQQASDELRGIIEQIQKVK